MSQNIERIVPENAPTPEQLRKLASIGMGSAVSRNAVRVLRNSRARYFIDEIESYDVQEHDAALGEQFGSHTRHRMVGRYGARSEDGRRVQSLKYYDVFWVQRGEQWLGERTRYSFEWDRAGTRLAERAFQLVGVERPDFDLSDEILQFQFSDDAPDMWHAQQEVEAVNQDDCVGLIEDVKDYFTKIDALHKAA